MFLSSGLIGALSFSGESRGLLFVGASNKFKRMEHSAEFEKLVAEVMPNICEISVAEAREKTARGAILIDVREDREWLEAHAENAIHIGRGVIERDIVHRFPDKQTELVLYCGGGFRSILAADNLQKMGYENVFSTRGGWTAWKEEITN